MCKKYAEGHKKEIREKQNNIKAKVMKQEILKEIAKFLCGVTAWESFVHVSLWSSNENPVVFGVTMTETLNQVQTFVPAIISIVLGYFAWFKK